MSASREKKQRQGIGPDPKAAKAQKEQADRRRKTIIYSIAAVVAALAVAALLVWSSGFVQSRMTAGTVGGEKMSVADLSYHYHTARNNYLEQLYLMYAQMGLTPNLPADTDVYDQESGKTYHDYYMETALDNASFITALYNEAVANGYKTADVKDEVDARMEEIRSEAASSGAGSYGAYLKAAYGTYITRGALKAQVERTALANKYYSDHQQELMDAYTPEQLDDYLAEHHDDLDTFEYTVFYVAAPTVETKDADGNDIDEEIVDQRKEEAMEQAKADAEEILLEYADGGDFDGIVEDFGLTETSCQDHASRVGSQINASLVYHDKLMELKEGESAVVEATSGYYAVVLHSRYLDTSSTRSVRHILITAETSTDADGKTVVTDEAWAAALEKIQEVKAEYEAGDKTEESFAALANKYSEDGGSNTNGGLYEDVEKGRFVTEFDSWMYDEARQPGDVSDPIAHGRDDESSSYYGYHLIYYVGESGKTVWETSAKTALCNDDLEAWRTDMTAQYPVTTNDNAKLVD